MLVIQVIHILQGLLDNSFQQSAMRIEAAKSEISNKRKTEDEENVGYITTSKRLFLRRGYPQAVYAFTW